MKNLTVNIVNKRDVVRLTKFEVVDVQENDLATPPHALVRLRFYGPGDVQYQSEYTVAAHDEQASTCLRVKEVQQNYGDLLESFGQVCAGAYTAVATAWNGNVGANPTKRKRLAAVEAVLVSSGLLTAEFVST